MDQAQLQQDQDWAALAGLISQAELDPVTDIDLMRLRRSVRQALPARSKPLWDWKRWVASAAAGVLGFATLTALFVGGGLDGGVPEAQAAPVRLVRGDGGAVVFHFSENKTHRITKSHSLHGQATREVKITNGKNFVDRNGNTHPGEIVFYRID